MEAISVRCNACNHTLKVGADKAGRKAKCPKCEAVVTIPAAAAPLPVTPAPPPADDESEGSYGVVVDHELVERRRQLEEEDRRRAKEAKKKKPGKVKRKFQGIPNAEEWEKARFGLLFVFFGTLVWAFTHALHGLWVLLGSVEYLDYSRTVLNEIARGGEAVPAGGGFWNISQLNLLLGIVAGSGAFATFAKICLILETVLYFVQAILWFVGAFLCLPAPNRFGMTGQLTSFLALGGVNFFVMLFLKLLPVVGAYQYYLVPFVLPEVALSQYNVERVYPFHVLWSGSPFWENSLTLILEFLFFLQPAFMSMFIWSVGLSLKERRLEEAGSGVTQLTFGQYYILLSFHLLSLCGTTPVLIGVVRVLYVLWYCFLMMFIVRLTLLVANCRHVIDLKINPEAHD